MRKSLCSFFISHSVMLLWVKLLLVSCNKEPNVDKIYYRMPHISKAGFRDTSLLFAFNLHNNLLIKETVKCSGRQNACVSMWYLISDCPLWFGWNVSPAANFSYYFPFPENCIVLLVIEQVYSYLFKFINLFPEMYCC